MSGDKQPRRFNGPDGARLSKTGLLTGLVKTDKGYAVLTARIRVDGTLESATLSRSQAEKVYVAMEHKRAIVHHAWEIDK